MKNYFTIRELCITGDTVPVNIADKLIKYHILPMNSVREELGIPITASQKSGYRPAWWEIAHNRSGDSQHTFEGKGAVDWTCKDFSENKDKLLELIIQNTEYKRVAVYNTFIHCDYKGEGRKLFKSGSDSHWEFVREL
jgi:hypothetical protein